MGREAWRDVATDHFDVGQQRFFNPWAETDRGIPDLLRWWATARREPWPTFVENRPYLAPPAVHEGQVSLTMIGHASVLVRVDGFTLLTDPQFSTHAGPFGRFGSPRVRPPGIEPRDLPAINAVFVSHNHYDHLDIASLRWLAAQRAPACFVVPLGLKRPLERKGVGPIVELDWWESTDVIGAEVVVTPAQHWSSRVMADRRKTLWGGCYLKVPYAPCVYFAGDSGYAPYFATIRQRLGAPDVALLPIGAYEPRWFMKPMHMNPEEAVRAHREVGAKWSIATHHGYFRLADDGFESPARLLADARGSAGVPPDEFSVLDVGETVVLGA